MPIALGDQIAMMQQWLHSYLKREGYHDWEFDISCSFATATYHLRLRTPTHEVSTTIALEALVDIGAVNVLFITFARLKSELEALERIEAEPRELTVDMPTQLRTVMKLDHNPEELLTDAPRHEPS